MIRQDTDYWRATNKVADSKRGSEGEERLRVLFVAGLEPVRGGGAGGQLTEASTLFTSELAKRMVLVPLSSTMESVPPPPLWRRATQAARRTMRFICSLPRVDVVFVYAADGPSLFEKGVMCLLARTAGRGVVVRFGSGALIGTCERSALVRRWLRLVLRSTHVVSVQGEFWRAWFSGFREAAGKLVVVGNGLKFGKEQRRNLPGHTMVFVGWLQREKGIFELLDVFVRVREAYEDARLIVAGGGRDEAAFDAEVERRGLSPVVSRLGWIGPSEVVRVLGESDVFVLPSHAEGLPNAMLEAMAAGVPVVATEVGSIPDVVEQGRTGYTSAVGDVETMAKNVCSVFARPEAAVEMGRLGSGRVRADYDIRTVWPKHAAAIARAGLAARGAGRDGREGRGV